MYLDHVTLTIAPFLLQEYQCQVAALEREIKNVWQFLAVLKNTGRETTRYEEISSGHWRYLLR